MGALVGIVYEWDRFMGGWWTDGCMEGQADACMCVYGRYWLVYGVFPKQDLEASMAPPLGWGGFSMGSGFSYVTLCSRQTWGELEQSVQTGRAQVCILTADRRPGSWTALGGRSRCPLRSTLQGKRRRKSGSGYTTLQHCPRRALDWCELLPEIWRIAWSSSMSTDSCGYVKRVGRFLGGPPNPRKSLETSPALQHRSHSLNAPETSWTKGSSPVGSWLLSVMASKTLAILAQARVCVLCFAMGKSCLNSTLLLGSLSLWLLCGMPKHKIVT